VRVSTASITGNVNSKYHTFRNVNNSREPTTAESPETLGTPVVPTSVKTKQQLRL
jgi:hypothetical protein